MDPHRTLRNSAEPRRTLEETPTEAPKNPDQNLAMHRLRNGPREVNVNTKNSVVTPYFVKLSAFAPLPPNEEATQVPPGNFRESCFSSHQVLLGKNFLLTLVAFVGGPRGIQRFYERHIPRRASRRVVALGWSPEL